MIRSTLDYLGEKDQFVWFHHTWKHEKLTNIAENIPLIASTETNLNFALVYHFIHWPWSWFIWIFQEISSPIRSQLCRCTTSYRHLSNQSNGLQRLVWYDEYHGHKYRKLSLSLRSSIQSSWFYLSWPFSKICSISSIISNQSSLGFTSTIMWSIHHD